MSFAFSRVMMLPRPFWLMAIIIGFAWWWPVGLAVLLTRLWWRKQMRTGNGTWQFPDMSSCMSGCTGGRFSYTPPSGNRAFDDYRAETLRRLEDEQKEFVEYLDRLRQARDRQEFEQFMAERRRRSTPTTDEAPPQA